MINSKAPISTNPFWLHAALCKSSETAKVKVAIFLSASSSSSIVFRTLEHHVRIFLLSKAAFNISIISVNICLTSVPSPSPSPPRFPEKPCSPRGITPISFGTCVSMHCCFRLFQHPTHSTRKFHFSNNSPTCIKSSEGD